MTKHAIAAIALVATLALPLTARAQGNQPVFTVDCNSTIASLGDGGDGLWVVGNVFLRYILGHPLLTGVSCTTAPATSQPVIPPDGVVCFCPSKVDTTNCNAHADVSQATTTGYCLQSPLNDPSATVSASTAVFRRGRLRRLRLAHALRN